MPVVPKTLEFRGFYWFGNKLGIRCDNLRDLKRAKRTTANVDGDKPDRHDSYEFNEKSFNRVESISGVVDLLSGD